MDDLILDLETWMANCVRAQDAGKPVGEAVTKAVGMSASYALMTAIHDKRLRMIKAGDDVIAPPVGSEGFVLGFSNDRPNAPKSAESELQESSVAP
jgi:hypothetical protein